MNKSKLKTYAPQARKDFIAAVTQRANLLGLSESAGKFEALPAERRGDVVLIAGREWPASVAQQRDRLVRRIQRDGGGWWLVADNPDQARYPRKACAGPDCVPIGRVVFRQGEDI